VPAPKTIQLLLPPAPETVPLPAERLQEIAAPPGPEGQGAAWIGGGLVFLSAVGFSAKAILIKLCYRHGVDAETLLALRMGLSLPFFLLGLLLAGRDQPPLTARDRLAVIALGLLGFYLAAYLDFLGLQYISAALERLILFLYPTLVVVFSFVLFRRPIGRWEALALVLGYVGIALVAGKEAAGQQAHHQGDVLLGGALVLGSTLAFAFYLIGSGRAIARLGANRFTGLAMSVASLACLAQFAVGHPPEEALRLPPEIYAMGAIMAVFSTILPSYLLSLGIHRLGSSRASLVSSIGPVATIGLAYIFLDEVLSPAQALGATLVVAGALLAGTRP